jgi:nucleotide-binding universal stress UspA family protein
MANPIKNILLPIDGSESSLKAIAFAGDLARLSDAMVTLLRVHDPQTLPIVTMGEIPSVISPEMIEMMEKDLNDPGKNPCFEQAKKELGIDEGKVREQIMWGQPAKTICEFAENDKSDLIVISPRGHSVFSELLLGSVSSQVVHHAPCPVTIVR